MVYSLDLSLNIEQQLLYSMKRIRHIEEAISARYNEWKMRCPVHLSVGQEAVSAAVGLALRKEDLAVSGHRAHGHYLGKGGSIKRMLAEIYGKKTGCSSGKGGSMHLIDESVGFMGSTAIVGGTIPIGVGLGLSFKLNGSDQVSCVFLGDGAVEEGVFYESANFAVLKKLPVLFICENNFYSVYSPLRVRQPESREIYKVAEAIGLKSQKLDGNLALSIYSEAMGALARIRSGNGPEFLEFTNYRWREHCGPNFDNDIGYRTEEEYLEWRKKEPIEPLQEVLLAKGVLTAESLGVMERKIAEETESAFRFAEDSSFPETMDAYTHLYSQENKNVDA